MLFTPNEWVPKLPEIPDTVNLCDFVFEEQHGRAPFSESKDGFTCGISGKTIKASEQKERVQHLARALAKEFSWKVNEGSEYDKVAGVFALNTVCT